MLTIGFVISILIQVVLPIVLGYLLVRRYNVEWWILVIGVLAYLFAQVIQMPLFQALGDLELYQTMVSTGQTTLVIVILSFLAALIENSFRVGAFWLIRERAKAWGSSLVMGAGHGGFESLMVGFQFLATFIFAVSLTNSGMPGVELTPEEAADMSKQIEAFWALPWYLPLASALQRLSALALQLVLSVMIWIAVTRRIWLFALAALLWHTAIKSVADMVAYSMPDIWNSLLMFGLMLVNIAIILLLYRKAKETGPMEVPVQPAAVRGLSFLEREREEESKKAPEDVAKNYNEVMEAKRARQRQLNADLKGDEGGDAPGDR